MQYLDDVGHKRWETESGPPRGHHYLGAHFLQPPHNAAIREIEKHPELRTGTRRNPRIMAAVKTSTEQSASVPLSLISQKEVSPQDAREVLAAALTAHDYVDCVQNLAGWDIDPQAYVDGLDHVRSHLSALLGTLLTKFLCQMISILSPGSDIYYRSLRALRKTCGIYKILPASYRMPLGLALTTVGKMKRPFASGGYSDVWKARNDAGEVFAIKHLRTYQTDDLTNAKKVPCVCNSASQCFS